MAAPSPPPPHHARPVAAALSQSEPLNGLMQRVRESQARFEAVRDLLPPGLQTETRPGPLDDTAWVLLAANAAGAAKLRHLLPTLHQALAAAGWPAPPIRIKVLPRA